MIYNKKDIPDDLQKYFVRAEIGLEQTPEAYIEKLVRVFREVRRVLKEDGTLWLNLGDSYCSTGGAGGTMSASGLVGGAKRQTKRQTKRPEASDPEASDPEKFGRWNKDWGNAKPKDLLMMPARVGLALQSDGWFLRSQIPWLKRNCMPESVTDRPTSAVEYVFLLAKSADYYYDHDAVKMPVAPTSVARLQQDIEGQLGTERANGGAKTNGNFKAVCSQFPHNSNEARKERAREGTKSFPADGRNGIRPGPGDSRKHTARSDGDGSESRNRAEIPTSMARNRRNSDWFWESWQGLQHDQDGEPLAFVVNPQPYRDAHFATWPPKLVLPMILAGSRAGDTVLDPFFGSGTTGMVAIENGRNAIGCELNPAYCQLAR